MRQQSTDELVSHLRQPQAALSFSSWNRFLVLPSPIEMWKCDPFPVRLENGFGMKRRDHAHLIGDLGRGHLEEDVAIGRRQRIGIGEVHFELAVRVFVIDLIDVDADRRAIASTSRSRNAALRARPL